MNIPDSRSAVRGGFTVTELLVSLAVIGLLLSVTLPAIQHVRETGRATTCRNHLSQFSKAIAHFESQYKRLPPIGNSAGARARIEDGAPHVALLPFIEMKPLYEQLKVDGGFGPAENIFMLRERPDPEIELFLCPSDQGSIGTNYRFNTGADVTTWQARHIGRDGGPMDLFPGLELAQVTDGLSNTAIVCESLKGTGNSSKFDPERDCWMAGLGFDTLPDETFTNEYVLTLCAQAAANPRPFFPYSGWRWTFGGLESTSYNHVVTPNASMINCNNTRLQENGIYILVSYSGIQKASSRHPEGVNLAMLDGVVRFVSDTIDMQVWQALGTAASGD